MPFVVVEGIHVKGSWLITLVCDALWYCGLTMNCVQVIIFIARSNWRFGNAIQLFIDVLLCRMLFLQPRFWLLFCLLLRCSPWHLLVLEGVYLLPIESSISPQSLSIAATAAGAVVTLISSIVRVKSCSQFPRDCTLRVSLTSTTTSSSSNDLEAVIGVHLARHVGW